MIDLSFLDTYIMLAGYIVLGIGLGIWCVPVIYGLLRLLGYIPVLGVVPNFIADLIQEHIYKED
jgi:hypothetical protein